MRTFRYAGSAHLWFMKPLIPYRLTLLMTVILYLSFASCARSQHSLQVRYIGNMGIVAHTGKAAVLIDGLHRQYGAAYAYPDAALVKQIFDGDGIYGDISVVLVTHVHGDHFDHDLVANYLVQRPKVHLVAPDQTVDSLRAKTDLFDAISDRVHAMRSEDMTVGNIKIRTIPVRHSYQARHHWVENNACLIEIDGQRVMHFGDADLDDPFFTGSGDRIAADLVIFPYWFLLNEASKSIWQRRITASYIVGTHINPMISDADLDVMRKLTPGATFFKTPRDEVRFE